MSKVNDRQAVVAALLGFGGIALLVPILLAMLFISAWLFVLGDTHVHGQVWGWLSHHNLYTDKKGVRHESWPMNKIPLIIYCLAIVSLWLAYQVAEGLNYLVRHTYGYIRGEIY